MIKDYSNLTSRIYTQLSPELSQEFHNMLTDMASELSRLYEIENAKPSIALEKVNHILSLFGGEKVQIETMTLSKCNILTIKQALMKAEEDKKFIDLILNKPQLLNCFGLDGVLTWEDFEDTYSDEDKEYINTTKEEFEFMRNQLIKRGKINE